MTETTPAERRERYAAKISKGGFGQSLRELTDAAISVADAEQAELRARLADYENRITWETTCGSCARVLDSSIRETERAEQAEAATEAYRLALSLALGLGTGANWEAIRDRGRDLVAEVAELTRAVLRLGGREQAPADRAAILQQEADRIRAHCPDHLDSDSQPGSWMVCHCDVADEMLRRLAAAASGPGGAAGETQQDEPEALPMLFWDEPAGVVYEDGRITAWLSKAVSLAHSVPAGQLILQPDAGARLRRELTTALNDADDATAEHHTVDGTRYLCHTDDHYCQPAAVPQPGKEA